MDEKTFFFQENTGKEHHQINLVLYENHIKIWHCMATQAVGRLCWNKGVCPIWKLPPGNTEQNQKSSEGINYWFSSSQLIKAKTKKSWTRWSQWEFCHWPCRKPSFQPGRTSAELSFISVLTALLAASLSLNTTFKQQDKAKHRQHGTERSFGMLRTTAWYCPGHPTSCLLNLQRHSSLMFLPHLIENWKYRI